MRSFLLTAAIYVAFAGGAFAQNLPPVYRWEIGVNGGYSTITRPDGPPAVYSGNSTNVSKDYSLRASYYFNWHWMMSVDIGNRRWESFGEWQMDDRYGKPLNPYKVKFLIADHAITSSVQMNYVIPFYSQFTTFNRANLYFGAQAGMVNTVNDGSRSYGVLATDSSVRYTNGVNYGSGMGYTLGLQTGFIYYITPRFGVNAELALRYVDVHTTGDHWAAPISHYRLMHFPQTLGIRWRLY
ncbi:hypothetical protein GCM10023093_09790 [Nemorincola caseinilytica]|uniref:Outer membrane protein beta-barrel domain-containing protein n=1 Tax=Nemorincola caseinilytica TaxID=2054315 RepID=A0ABP8NAQ0_9BACT